MQLQYIGARYVPVWYVNSVDQTANWEVNVEYEPLTWVTSQNNHLYLSKKTVPDNIGTPAQNTEYWLDMGIFSGGGSYQDLQDQIDAAVARLDADELDIASIQQAVSDLQQAISGLATATRKIIFIGDSYMTGEASGGLPTITSFVDYFATYSGLVLGTDVFVSAQSGYGFKDDGFKTLLQNVSIGTTDPNSITDIIVLGGINDATLIGSNFSTFEQKMADFVTYAKATYENAKIRVGYISKDYEGRFLYNINGVAAYKCINRNGGFYLTGIENTLRELGHFRSDGHPSVDGQKVLGRALVDAVFYGSCSPAYGSQPVSITAASGVTITANEMVANASNGVVTISAHNWSKFTFASRSFTSPTDPLYIGEMDSGLLIGESDTYKYIPVTLVLVGSTNYQLEGKLLFSNKGVYAFPWQQLTIPTGITELRIAPFSFTLNSANI